MAMAASLLCHRLICLGLRLRSPWAPLRVRGISTTPAAAELAISPASSRHPSRLRRRDNGCCQGRAERAGEGDDVRDGREGDGVPGRAFQPVSGAPVTLLLTHVCFEKCIEKRHKEAELNMGENSCIDRCVSKYWQVTNIVGGMLGTQQTQM
ncbi:hypothetical protein ZWY2020_018833 [Hordeum vulgare]|nr:hypothetical protein ZWY2020_018833 [Hordeum vulgare]